MDLRILNDDELKLLVEEIHRELTRREIHDNVLCPMCNGSGQRPREEAGIHGRCAKCGGTGRIGVEYCSCVMGRDLERVEKRNLSALLPASERYTTGEPDYTSEDGDEL